MTSRQTSIVLLIGKCTHREFPSGPVVRIWHFHCQGPGLIPGWGTNIPYTMWLGQKKERKKYNHSFHLYKGVHFIKASGPCSFPKCPFLGHLNFSVYQNLVKRRNLGFYKVTLDFPCSIANQTHVLVFFLSWCSTKIRKRNSTGISVQCPVMT